MSFSLLRRERKGSFVFAPSYPSPIIDAHCHILPGFKDGPETLEQSLHIVKELVKTGMKRFIAAPHIMKGYYNPNPVHIRETAHMLQQAVKAAGIDAVIEPAAEYYLDEGFLSLIQNQGDILAFGEPRRYVLMETGMIRLPELLSEAIAGLKARGYVPVMAHPERYIYLQQSPDQLFFLRSMGVQFQVDLSALIGRQSSSAKRFAEWIIEQGLVSFWGTNIHREDQLPDIKQALLSTYYRKTILKPSIGRL